jgi:uncharacterized protein YfbU (UPF0304 family)
MKRKLVVDGMDAAEATALNTIMKLMDTVNNNTFSEEAQKNFMGIMKQGLGLQCIEAMQKKWVLTEQESTYLIDALNILVGSITNA